MLDTRLNKRIDLPLLGLTYLLGIFGIIIVYSATHSDPNAAYKKQIVWLILGSIALFTTTTVDFHLSARFQKHIYIFNLFLLTVVLKAGTNINGASRWIRIGPFPFQPSEFAKLFVILTLAAFLTRRYNRIRQPGTLILSLLYVLVPMALIFKQPDLGTALVLLAIWVGMVFMAGAQIKHLAALFLCGVLLFTGIWVSGKGLHDYQKRRLLNIVDPGSDPKGTGYHVLEARIAIGSGGFLGKGFLHSTQVSGNYIPEKQTDFIFTDIGEELGFVGGVSVTLLYALLLFRGTMIVAAAEEDILGKLIAAGIVTMIAFHVILNIGMNIGIMPVAGVPLPLISAGGSNMILTLICIGMLQSISRYRHQLLF